MLHYHSIASNERFIKSIMENRLWKRKEKLFNQKSDKFFDKTLIIKGKKITINLLYQQSLGHMNRQVDNYLWMEWLHTQF